MQSKSEIIRDIRMKFSDIRHKNGNVEATSFLMEKAFFIKKC